MAIRPPFRRECSGPQCGRLVEWHVVEYVWRPRLQRWDARWHAFDLGTDLGTGKVATTKRSHHLSCPDADKFGGRNHARPFPEEPVQEPQPQPERQRRLEF